MNSIEPTLSAFSLNRNLQEELINSHTLLDNIFESSPISMWISDETGTLLRMNDACRRRLNIQDHEIVGKYNLFNDTFIEKQGYMPMVKDVFEKKSIAHFTIIYNNADVKELKFNKTKSVVLDIRISPIVDAWGEVTNAIIQHIDITEIRKTHNALKFREERFSNLINNLNVGVLLHGPKAEVLLSNPKALELLGLTEEQLIGKTFFDSDWNVIQEDGSDFPAHTLPVPTAILSHKPVKDVILGIYRPKTKDHVWLSVSAEPDLNEDGSVQQVICTFVDVTEQKQSEKEISRLNIELRDLSNHLQNVSEEERSAIAKEIHDEFAQNLIALTMNAAYLNSKIKDLSKEDKEIIEEQIKIANGLIKTSRSLFNSLHPFMLDELGLEAAIGWYTKKKLKLSDIQFVLHIDINNEKLSNEISLGLFRIFQECLTNVLLHSKASKVVIDINKNDQTVIMEIQDNGNGFDHSKVDTKLHHGLLEIRERVYALDGNLNINALIGKGVFITIEIPI